MIIFIPQLEEIAIQAVKKLKESGHKIISGEINSSVVRGEVEALFIRTYVLADKKYLDQFPKLKFILKAGVGLDNIDMDEVKRKNIKVINAPGSNANAVAELVVCFMLMLLRNIRQQSHRLRHGEWRGNELMGEELKNKVIGFIGCGAIAKSAVQKIQVFDVREILGYDPYLDEQTLSKFKIKKVSLDSLIKKSDILSLHLPLTKETKDLITLKEIKLMKKKSYIINTSRGGIINENDLIVALKNKIIAGAALDVFKNEPNFNPGFLSLDNVILTPHIGAYTHEADLEMSMVPVKKFLSLTK